MNSRFQVEVNGKARLAEVGFATFVDTRSLVRWRWTGEGRNVAVLDAIEYARLACKRWRYYEAANSTVSSLRELQSAVGSDAKVEVAMILVARALWPSQTSLLGFAYCRRTWCHHIVIDFLSVHPRIINRVPERIRGVGTGLLNHLVTIAEALKIRCAWGEATAHSAPFYERALNVRPILDHFFIEDEVMDYCRRQAVEARQQMLARRTKR